MAQHQPGPASSAPHQHQHHHHHSSSGLNRQLTQCLSGAQPLGETLLTRSCTQAHLHTHDLSGTVGYGGGEVYDVDRLRTLLGPAGPLMGALEELCKAMSQTNVT